MSAYVDECRKEWRRLGVPEAVANEMAADLTADLAEAEAEGVSAENVLGNAIFDAKSFAASWALARGVVPLEVRVPRVRQLPWSVILSGAVSALLALGGLAIILRRSASSFAAPALRIGPRFDGSMFPEAVWAIGAALLVVGLVGAGLTFWYWRRSIARHGTRFEDQIDLPSYR